MSTEISGACERIVKTPLTLSYRVFLRQGVWLYLLVLPWGIIGAMDWWAIPLTIVRLPPSEQADLPFEYDIAMGVRRADRGLRAKLDETLRRKRAEIQAVLKEYAVPMVEPPAAVAADR